MTHLRSSALTIVGVSALVLAAEYLGWLNQLEKGSFDWLARQRRFEHVAEEIRVIGISEKDFRDFFQSKSPLPEAPLKSILIKLAAACPAVIGVDLVNPPQVDPQPTAACPKPPRLLYAVTSRRIDVAKGHTAGFGEWFLGRETPSVDLEGSPPKQFSGYGLPVLPLDDDGVVRRYGRQVRAGFSVPRGTSDLSTFNAAAVEEYCEAMQERGSEPLRCAAYEVLPETFYFGRWDEQHLVSLDAGEVMRPAFEDASASLRDKIVLLGGHFSASRDTYATPGGTYYGVDLLGLAIDSDLHHYWVEEVRPWRAFLLDLLVGTVIVVLFAVLRPVLAFAFSLTGTFVVAVVFSAYFFHRYSYALNFMSVAVGVVIHQLFVQLEKLQELERLEKHAG